VFLDGKY
jgi:hypothetical protein